VDGHSKGFEMVDEFLGEVTGFAENAPHAVSQTAVVTLNTYGVFLSYIMNVICKCFDE
jgi:hypothetical protein